MVVSVHEVVHVVWAEVDLQEATCSKELGTGSVLTRMYYFVFLDAFLCVFLFFNYFFYGLFSQGLWQPELCLEDGV